MKTRFATFDADNPHVYLKLIEIAMQAKTRMTKFGIAAMFERLRWISTFETTGDLYKLNNNFRAFYVRQLMRDYPEFRGFFSTRRSVADTEAA